MNTLSAHRLAAACALVACLLALSPTQALACACGCGVFDVGGSALFPTGTGGQAFVEYDWLDQSQNRHGASPAPASANDDKRIQSAFVTLGAQYMVDHAWGVMVQIPYWSRTFKTDGGSGVQTYRHAGLGDIRLSAMYTGFAPDMSTGVTLSLKLATGDFKYAGFDRDTQIGTGSTDLLLGAFHRGSLTRDNSISYFARVQWQKPLASQGDYRPGEELNAAVGAYYSGLTLGGGKVKVSPVLQLVGSLRARDHGLQADPDNSGYGRLLLSPGVEVGVGDWTLYGDVAFAASQYVNGDQLVAPQMAKLILSRRF